MISIWKEMTHNTKSVSKAEKEQKSEEVKETAKRR